MPSGTGDFLRILVGEVGTPKLAQSEARPDKVLVELSMWRRRQCVLRFDLKDEIVLH